MKQTVRKTDDVMVRLQKLADALDDPDCGFEGFHVSANELAAIGGDHANIPRPKISHIMCSTDVISGSGSFDIIRYPYAIYMVASYNLGSAKKIDALTHIKNAPASEDSVSASVHYLSNLIDASCVRGWAPGELERRTERRVMELIGRLKK